MKSRGEVDVLELIKSYSFSSTKSPVKTWKDEVKGLAQYLNILTRTEYITHSQLLKCSGLKKIRKWTKAWAHMSLMRTDHVIFNTTIYEGSMGG